MEDCAYQCDWKTHGFAVLQEEDQDGADMVLKIIRDIIKEYGIPYHIHKSPPKGVKKPRREIIE